MSGTAEVTAFYAQSWIHQDRGAVLRVIAPDAGIEWNLDQPVDDEELVQVLHRMAAFADSVEIVSTICTGDRAALVYDCAAPFGTVRMAEFLTVTDGLISEIRQAYDVVALRRYFPGLLD
ncbi:nuclear transport factor 2 family protein [Actinoplanes sp. NPDC051494]|uniref:nuclear transport factor 2 family protein n=1 Tax=Actinoplanes sp. NPDC051494 TaxID=3363907 RepID=UPI0037A03C79